MPDQTNITDFDPATGRTTTTLVSTHTRGAQDEATRDGQSHDTWHRDDMPPAAGDPQISTLAPQQVTAAAGPTTVTITGTNFVAGSVVEINGVAQATTFVNATTLTISYDPTVAGTVAITVRNPNEEESNSVGFKVV